MERIFSYAVILLAYLIGGGSLLFFVAFLISGPFGFVHYNISQTQALFWDAFLSILFFVQHSAMIRSSFRKRLTYLVQPQYQAAIYAVASGIVLAAVILLWQTTTTAIYSVHGPLHYLFYMVSVLAIFGMVWVVHALKTFDPFGRRSMIVHLRSQQQSPLQLIVHGPYFWVRHPIYFFMLVLIWSTPEMNLDRLIFNTLWTVWIVVGSYFEERDLVSEFGESYRQYQKIVPMLIPWKGPIGKMQEVRV